MMAKALESDLAQARATGLTRHGVPMFLSVRDPCTLVWCTMYQSEHMGVPVVWQDVPKPETCERNYLEMCCAEPSP